MVWLIEWGRISMWGAARSEIFQELPLLEQRITPVMERVTVVCSLSEVCGRSFLNYRGHVLSTHLCVKVLGCTFRRGVA
jgi:hypothetical protein